MPSFGPPDSARALAGGRACGGLGPFFHGLRGRSRGRAGGGEFCLSNSGAVCPLLLKDGCAVFDHRPLQCRTFGMDEGKAAKLWEVLSPALEKDSADLFFAFTGKLMDEPLPKFPLSDVVSGRYVQTCFHYMFKLA